MDKILGFGRSAGLSALHLMVFVTMKDFLPMTVEETFVPDQLYDFVVVGSGAAGSVVGGRLSETGASVLVLEAGGAATPDTVIPALSIVQIGQENNWNIKTEPQIHTQNALTGNRMIQPIGKAIGGSTTINGMRYMRGNSRDFDQWARMGNFGWDYQSVLPYFKKSEDFKGFRTSETDIYHGKGGPLSIEMTNITSVGIDAHLEAGKELGLRGLIDDSGPSQIGIAVSHCTIGNGLRASASEAFLKPNLHRRNLHVRDRAFVTKILFDASKRAIGVQYMLNNEARTVRVRKEVIVSCGAFLTPKLLMLSGVGPSRHLREMGIPVVADVEGVGRNLQDHPATEGLALEANKWAARKATDYVRPKELLRYLLKRQGFFANPYPYMGTSWLHLSGKGDPEWTDSAINFLPVTFATGLGLLSGAVENFKDEAFNALYGPLVGKRSIMMHLFLSRPKSRGQITLKSSDPFDDPRINPNFLDHPDDLELMLKVLKKGFEFANTNAFKNKLGARYVSKPLRYCQHLPFRSDDYWRCFLTSTVTTSWHAAGSSKMAPLSDPFGVVDPRLRLRGVSGVRVVDASIMPNIVAVNTMATTIMIGEKGADIIKQDWGYATDTITK